MKSLLFTIFLFISIEINAATYYVSPTGNDGAAGTLDAPWATWQYAFSRLKTGDILYVRGGIYYPSGTLSGGPTVGARLANKNGTAANPIIISAYNNEVPVLDCSKITQAGWKVGMYVDNCSYITFKGLTISSMNEHGEARFPADGWIGGGSRYITMDHCTVTRCGSGFMWGGGNDYIYFTNCDSYNNADQLFGAVSSGGPGGYCDGFGNHQVSPGAHIIYYGCRAWNNSDDGWDGMDSNGYITYTNCWSINNGQTLGDWTTVSGDGDGFKIGITPGAKEAGQQRILKNCMAIGNKLGGFDESQDRAANADMGIYNCTAYNNGRSGFGFYQAAGSGIATLKNCISYKNDLAGGGAQNVNLRQSSVQVNNSWQIAAKLSDPDFQSLIAEEAKQPRKPDGSLPEIRLMHLTTASLLVDAGADLGASFFGKAPDLGAFEMQNGIASAPVAAVPLYTSASVANSSPTILEMTYNTSLASISPEPSSVSVKVNSIARPVNSVGITGTKVQLTLSSAIKFGDTVTVAYAKPAANPLQGVGGEQAISFTAQPVVNNIISSPKDASPVTVKMTLATNHIHKSISVSLEYSSSLSTDASSITPLSISISDLSGRLFAEQKIKVGALRVVIPLNISDGVYKVVLTGGTFVLSTQNIRVY